MAGSQYPNRAHYWLMTGDHSASAHPTILLSLFNLQFMILAHS